MTITNQQKMLCVSGQKRLETTTREKSKRDANARSQEATWSVFYTLNEIFQTLNEFFFFFFFFFSRLFLTLSLIALLFEPPICTPALL